MFLSNWKYHLDMVLQKLVGILTRYYKHIASVALVIPAVFAWLFSRAKLAVRLNHESFPSPEELVKDSGSLFQDRPSDGGRLEWFRFGSEEPTATPWVIIHGLMNTGEILTLFPGVDARMKELNVAVIAPTLPGWGSSDGYNPTFDITSQVWLERWRQDAMALIDSLKIDNFWVSGMSLGAPPGLALAEAAAKQKRLLGHAPLIASMWNHPGFDLIEHYPTRGQRMITRLLSNSYVISAVAHYLVRPMILRKTKWKLPVDTVEWDAQTWGKIMQRSIRYQIRGFVQSMHIIYKPGGGNLIDWSAFPKEIPTYVFYGDNDSQLPTSVTTFSATKLPWAKLVQHSGGHFELDLVKVAETLFNGSN